MKKTTRVLVALLALTLVTSCFVGGTFAKYVTSIEEAADNARVAKWGVSGTVTGGAFATSYEAHDGETELDITVESSTEDKLVAPGTNGTFTGVSLTGTPEVAVKITKTATVTINDKWIDEEGAFYCPIVVTINGTPISGLECTDANDFAGKIKAAIELGSGEYEPNTNLATITNMNGNYTWAWAFDGDNVSDTYLGDQAALGNAGTIAIAASAIVEQID